MSKPRRISELRVELTPQESDLLAIVSEGETKRISYGTLREKILDSVATIQGWARYDDTTYTTGSSFLVTAGAADVTLPNNASGSIETHMHSDVAFYNPNTQKIQVENDGDVYTMTITFRARAAANPSTGDGFYIRLGNTTGTPYSRVRKDFYWPKTDQNWYYFHEVIEFYADSDFVTNGNAVQVHANGVNAEFAEIIYFIQRTQNHRAH
jgi:hypothetical protein